MRGFGDGWYSDGEPAPGRPRNFDYYSGWAMQFYPLWYCRISGDRAGTRACWTATANGCAATCTTPSA